MFLDYYSSDRWIEKSYHKIFYFIVPLAIFKREKEIARRLEFDGLYIAEQPSDDDMRVILITFYRPFL